MKTVFTENEINELVAEGEIERIIMHHDFYHTASATHMVGFHGQPLHDYLNSLPLKLWNPLHSK